MLNEALLLSVDRQLHMPNDKQQITTNAVRRYVQVSALARQLSVVKLCVHTLLLQRIDSRLLQLVLGSVAIFQCPHLAEEGTSPVFRLNRGWYVDV